MKMKIACNLQHTWLKRKIHEKINLGKEIYTMARVCDICGKGPITGNNVSHAHNKTKRRWLPNLQKVRTVTENGSTVRVNACTRCIRSGAVVKPA